MANFLKDMTNEQLKACLLDDMEMLRDGEWVPDDDSIDATVSVIEEVFRRIDVYSKKGVGASLINTGAMNDAR